MTNGRLHRAYYLQTEYHIRLMTSQVVTVQRESRGRRGRGLKQDLQLQSRERHAWDGKTGREIPLRAGNGW